MEPTINNPAESQVPTPAVPTQTPAPAEPVAPQPVAEAPSSMQTAPPADAVMPPAPAGKTFHVLLAEDEEMILETLADLLTEAGMRVTKAHNGEEARDIALEEKPDLLLWDIQMPRMTGLEALKIVRQDAWGKSVPVILLTNIGDVRNVAGALELQAYDYLIKSDMSLDDVVQVVQRKLGILAQ